MAGINLKIKSNGPDSYGKGLENLNKAIEILRGCGADGWLRNMRKSWLQFHDFKTTFFTPNYFNTRLFEG